MGCTETSGSPLHLFLHPQMELVDRWYQDAQGEGHGHQDCLLASEEVGQFQVRIHKPITVHGMEFEIHGVLDALKEGVIFDFKFKNKSFGSIDLPGTYLDSAQHPFYFYLVPEARKFLYLVSDGSDIYIEQYTPEESRDAYDIIAEFVDFLNSAGLMDEYKKHWAV